MSKKETNVQVTPAHKVVFDELLHYLEFSDKLAADLEESECLNVKTR
jgi:hypothetical protein